MLRQTEQVITIGDSSEPNGNVADSGNFLKVNTPRLIANCKNKNYCYTFTVLCGNK